MCKEKIEDLAGESSNKRTNESKNLQDDEDDEKTERGEIILSANFCAYPSAYQLTRTVPSDCRDSKETSPKLSNSNSGKSVKILLQFYNFY